MRLLDSLSRMIIRFSNGIAAFRRLASFTCGDCAQSESCGLPPNEKCVMKVMQISRGAENCARPPNIYRPAIWREDQN
jgi:positive regulator of sigma E activity